MYVKGKCLILFIIQKFDIQVWLNGNGLAKSYLNIVTILLSGNKFYNAYLKYHF